MIAKGIHVVIKDQSQVYDITIGENIIRTANFCFVTAPQFYAHHFCGSQFYNGNAHTQYAYPFIFSQLHFPRFWCVLGTWDLNLLNGLFTVVLFLQICLSLQCWLKDFG